MNQPIRKILFSEATGTLHHSAARFMLAIVLTMLTTLTAQATDFITDVMVIGNNDKTQFDNLQNSYEKQGWTAINKDLNAGCGTGSDYIHLLYKTTASTYSSGTPITGFYIRTGDNPPASLINEDDGCTYYLIAYDGSTNFKNSQGDLNRGAGGDYIHLYYTTEVAPGHPKVTGITFNNIQNGAVGANGGTTGYDLNAGCGSGTNYIYMHVATFMVMLTSESADVELQDGIMLTGTGGANTHVTIADGATVTLSGVDITGITSDQSHQWAGITCLGDAVIILDEDTTNDVKGGYSSSGIFVPEGKTLTIQGSGTLNATGNSFSAGIGSYYKGTCGHITICGGTINATGGGRSAGIGTGAGTIANDNRATCGNITISGGVVSAIGDTNAPGIGGGWYSSCANITISGGTINSTGGENASGIGSGQLGQCGDITISSGVVKANGGSNGAGIGSGAQASCGNVTITTGVISVTATKGANAPYSIGKGHDLSWHCGIVTIGGIETGFIKQSPFTYDPTLNVAYTLSFDSNGGTGTVISSRNYLYGLAMALPDCTYTRTGYEFAGWSTTASGAVEYADGVTISTPTITNGAVTLYAQWTENVLELTDNASNATTIAAAAATYKTYNRVTLSGRTLYKDGNWNTLCLPFDVDNFAGTPLEGATVRTLTSTSFSNGTLTMTFSNDQTSVEAGKPYIVKWAGGSNIANPVFSGVTIRNSTYNVSTTYVDFVGTYSPVVYNDVNRSVLFLGSGSKLYYPDGTAPTTIGACRAYFELKNGLTAGAPSTGVRAFVLNFGEDGQTGISLTPAPSPKGEGSNYWYTLDGRKLNGKPIKRGVYLRSTSGRLQGKNNGRKTVIK